MNNIILEVKNVKKQYGKLVALHELNLKLERGKILGLLGENGAGKSTAISIISGELGYDGGEILYQGRPLAACKRKFQSNLGFVPQEIALFQDLSCYENLKFWAKVYGVEPAKINDRIKEVAEIFEMKEVLQRRPDKLSGGYQRRLNIACAILHKPELLFLDEPTVGIDVSIRKSILKTVRAFADGGMSVLYTSHYIDELQEISDEVLIIKEGRALTTLKREDFSSSSLEEIYLKISGADLR